MASMPLYMPATDMACPSESSFYTATNGQEHHATNSMACHGRTMKKGEYRNKKPQEREKKKGEHEN
ncbi:hypothetical protein D8674_011904 [Pyrus ussuriensis x Pyrus communis]|uniref:Uncharacterized protein n=1 Tax=Pyrus ussuriensis x Pyrus communis TaxID=2448454 RepID=A0A5N5G046_9ROSA|nr:hypothetical protein D8674_011904 [Pyrus ussuriensis x Pyrus communis]